jgi:hypothetical protein
MIKSTLAPAGLRLIIEIETNAPFLSTIEFVKVKGQPVIDRIKGPKVWVYVG